VTSSDLGNDLVNDTSPCLAIFSFTPQTWGNIQFDICLETGILVGATVSIYINEIFTWTLSSDPYGKLRRCSMLQKALH